MAKDYIEIDPYMYCRVSKADIEADPQWLERNKGAVHERLPNGDVIMRFRQSELRKVPD